MGLTGVKLTLPPVRFSYLHALEPQISRSGRENFGSMLIIPKSDKKTIRAIENALQEAFLEGKALLGVKSDKMPTKSGFTTFYDGDDDRPDDPACEDCMYLNTSSNRKVEVFNSKLIPIVEPDKVYSGMYGRASVTFKAYVTEDGGKGIACYLNGIQKTKEGTRLDGQGSAKSAFDDDFDDFDIEDEDNDFQDTKSSGKKKKDDYDDL